MFYIELNQTVTIDNKVLVCKESRNCHECEINFKICKDYACMPLERKDGKWTVFKKVETEE